MRLKKQLDEVSRFLETFPKLIDRPKDINTIEDIFLKDFLLKIIAHNQNVQKESMIENSNNN